MFLDGGQSCRDEWSQSRRISVFGEVSADRFQFAQTVVEGGLHLWIEDSNRATRPPRARLKEAKPYVLREVQWAIKLANGCELGGSDPHARDGAVTLGQVVRKVHRRSRERGDSEGGTCPPLPSGACGVATCGPLAGEEKRPRLGQKNPGGTGFVFRPDRMGTLRILSRRSADPGWPS